ncbi:MAG: hypothetical protein JXR37_16740 [Kiritimatiellae bacterium]|nr:hypothetical protein [Kiritimatiellia bacterium]
MRRSAVLCVPIVLLLSAVTLVAQAPQDAGSPAAAGQGQPNIPLLATTGVPAGPPESVLAKGAFLHVRLNNVEKLAHDLDALVASFLPDQAMPAAMQPILDSPQPLLAFLGQQSIGQPLSADAVAVMFGIDVRRPIALTYYPAQKGFDFVLCLPMADGRTLTGMLLNILKPTTYEKTELNGQPCYHVVPGQGKMRRDLYVVCSTESAYFCSSPAVAGLLAAGGPQQRLAQSDFVPTAVALCGERDVAVVLDAALLKQFLPVLEQQLGTIRPETIAKMRSALSGRIPEAQQLQIDWQIRSRLGLSGLDELLDYVECFGTATYEVLAKELIRQLAAAQGLSFALDLGARHQALSVAVFSETIRPAACTRPLPMRDVKKAMAMLPGARYAMWAHGRRPKRQTAAALNDWLDLLAARLSAKELSAPAVSAFIAYMRGSVPGQPMGAESDWTVNTGLTPAAAAPQAYESLEQFWTALGQGVVVPATVGVMSTEGCRPGFLEAYFRAETDALERNEQLYRQFVRAAGSREPWLRREVRFRAEPAGGGVSRLVFDRAYVTQSGVFGYDQHELVNRRVLFCKEAGNRMFVHHGATGAEWLQGPDLGKETPLRAAVLALLENVPAEANTLQILHHYRLAEEVLALLETFEELIHKENDACLAKAKELLASQPPDEAAESIGRMLLPMSLVSVNRDPASGELYGVLPGNLAFPRPKLMPAVRALCAEYLGKSESVGGGLAYTRVVPGRFEAASVNSTEGLALLVKTAVNAFHARYAASPEAQQALGLLLRTPRDTTVNKQHALVVNPMWQAFVR